jgi:fermentation-respiration switch protein FrsA (DUF1100 family)
MKEEFVFASGSSRVVGRLYRPAAPAKGAVILTGPLTSVKEQATGAYAHALAERDLVALAFDHRFFGESGGEPRQFENPYAKIEDIGAAADALRRDPRTGHLPLYGVGVCAGGGYMARAVAELPGFTAFAGVAGYYSAANAASMAAAAPAIDRARDAERRWRATGVAETIPAVALDGGDVAMPLREAFEYYGTPRGAVANYNNAYAVQSGAYTIGFNALDAAAHIGIPTLLVHSEHALAPRLARSFFAALPGPRRELWIESRGQIDFYDDPVLIDAAADAIAQWFDTHRVVSEQAR